MWSLIISNFVQKNRDFQTFFKPENLSSVITRKLSKDRDLIGSEIGTAPSCVKNKNTAFWLAHIIKILRMVALSFKIVCFWLKDHFRIAFLTCCSKNSRNRKIFFVFLRLRGISLHGLTKRVFLYAIVSDISSTKWRESTRNTTATTGQLTPYRTN